MPAGTRVWVIRRNPAQERVPSSQDGHGYSGGDQVNSSGPSVECDLLCLMPGMGWLPRFYGSYYAGTTPVLVHNSCGSNPFRGTNMSDEDSLAYHFATHGDGRTIEQYAQDAHAFAQNPTGKSSSVVLNDGTTGTRYRTRGGPGGILDSNGNVVTFWYK